MEVRDECYTFEKYDRHRSISFTVSSHIHPDHDPKCMFGTCVDQVVRMCSGEMNGGGHPHQYRPTWKLNLPGLRVKLNWNGAAAVVDVVSDLGNSCAGIG